MSQPRRDSTGLSTSEMVRAAIRGEESGWEILVGRYWRRIYALARSRGMGPELSEEITQSVFATVAAKLTSDGYREAGRFESWLFRIAMNRVRDAGRRRTREAQRDDGSALPDLVAAPPQRDGSEDLETLRRALATLEDADREVIALRHHADLPFKTIAEMLGEPLGTVLARHHRALRKLRDLMETPATDAVGKAGKA